MSISPKESLGGILSQLPRTAFMRAGDAPFLRGALITKVTAVTRVAIDVEPTQLSRQGYVRLQVRSHYHAFRRNPDHRAQASVWSACHDNFLRLPPASSYPYQTSNHALRCEETVKGCFCLRAALSSIIAFHLGNCSNSLVLCRAISSGVASSI